MFKMMPCDSDGIDRATLWMDPELVGGPSSSQKINTGCSWMNGDIVGIDSVIEKTGCVIRGMDPDTSNADGTNDKVESMGHELDAVACLVGSKSYIS